MPTIGRRFHFNYRFLLSAALVLVVTVPAFGKSDGLCRQKWRHSSKTSMVIPSSARTRPLEPAGTEIAAWATTKTWLLGNETKDALPTWH